MFICYVHISGAFHLLGYTTLAFSLEIQKLCTGRKYPNILITHCRLRMNMVRFFFRKNVRSRVLNLPFCFSEYFSLLVTSDASYICEKSQSVK